MVAASPSFPCSDTGMTGRWGLTLRHSKGGGAESAHPEVTRRVERGDVQSPLPRLVVDAPRRERARVEDSPSEGEPLSVIPAEVADAPLACRPNVRRGVKPGVGPLVLSPSKYEREWAGAPAPIAPHPAPLI